MITNKKKLQSKSCHIDTCIKQYMLYEISFFLCFHCTFSFCDTVYIYVDLQKLFLEMRQPSNTITANNYVCLYKFKVTIMLDRNKINKRFTSRT